MNEEDKRYWLYKYVVSYSIGYQCGGFPLKSMQEQFIKLIAEAHDKYRNCYRQPSYNIIMLSSTEGIFFDGWEAQVQFTEWGPNRTFKNWPHDIELIDKIINHLVEGMGGNVTKRELHEMPIVFNDVSERLNLPYQKTIPNENGETN